MDRAAKLDQLVQAEAHVAKGQDHISRQREIIAGLKQNGTDAATAELLLHRFEEAQALHIEHRDRILAELGNDRPLASLSPDPVQRVLNLADELVWLITTLRRAAQHLDIAREDASAERAERHIRHAREAYDSAQVSLPQLKLTSEQRTRIEDELSRLSSRLKAERK
jgi:hypothetical protein